jgi:hypothetical protein
MLDDGLDFGANGNPEELQDEILLARVEGMTIQGQQDGVKQAVRDSLDGKDVKAAADDVSQLTDESRVNGLNWYEQLGQILGLGLDDVKQLRIETHQLLVLGNFDQLLHLGSALLVLALRLAVELLNRCSVLDQQGNLLVQTREVALELVVLAELLEELLLQLTNLCNGEETKPDEV